MPLMRTWKAIFVPAFVLSFCLAAQVTARAQVWPNGYSYRRTVTIDHTKVPNTDQTNFPILISGTYSYLATTPNGGGVTSSSGYDIIFTSDAYGLNVLPFEQESYNPSTGAVIYWVQVPTVSHTSDTVIYLFYGNSSVTDQSNKNGVWDSSYKGVWHLDETSGQQKDSTANGNNSTAVSLTAEGTAAGQIKGSDQFNAAHPDHVDLPNITLSSAFTLEAWIYPTAYVDNARIVAKAYSSNTSPWVDYSLLLDTASDHKLAVGFDQSGTLVYFVSNGTIPLNQWTHVVGTYNGSSLRLFINGTQDSSETASGSIATVSQTTEIGYNNVYGPQSFTGNIDEVRISAAARSADWIAAEYNTESSPATFYSTGTATSYDGPNISLSPSFGDIGSSITIAGTNFGSSQGSSTVTFAGAAATVTSWSSTQIVATVPNAAVSGNVVVTVGSQPSNGVQFTIGSVWSNGYGYRRTITIDHTKVPNTDQANFPLLFSGTYSYLATTSNGGAVTNSSGYDIIFTSDAYGLNVLPFEQEGYNASTGAVSYWIQIPTLSHTSDTIIYLFYRNSSVTTDQSNKNGVWDGNYLGVWHFPNGTPLSAIDSTSNGNNGTVSGPTATTGKIGGGASFTGGSNKISIGTSGSLTAPFTIEEWAEPASLGYYFGLFGSRSPSDGSFDAKLTGSGVHGDIGNGSSWLNTSANGSLSYSANTWHHFVYVVTTSGYTIYGDGSQIGSGTLSGTPLLYDSNHTLVLGATGYSGESFNGSIDETRLSNVARSADWIVTEFNNENSPGTFYTLGSASSYTGPDISSLSPTSGNIAVSVTITGTNFGSSQGTSTVTFGGAAATATSWSSTQIVATVPNAAVSGNVLVTVASQPSNGMQFEVIGGGTWSNGYGYRRAITIDHTKVPNSDQKNFTMLFSGTYAYLATTSNGGAVTNSNGYDIVFALDAAGTITLPFEQDGYNPSTGTVNYWVQIPSLSHTTDTAIFLFFGNSLVTTDQSNKNGTWDHNYKGVWHMPNGSTLTSNDSTSNGNNGTISGSTATTGFFDGGANFSSTNTQYISIPDSSSLKPANVTFSFWMQRIGSQHQSAHALQKGAGPGSPFGSYFVQLNDSGSDSSEGSATVGTTDNVSNTVTFPSGSFSGGIWYYVVGTFNSSTRVVTAYKNGQPVGATTAAVGTISYDTTGLQLGRQPTYGDYFNGILDEVRVSSIDRSADWIATEYSNQSSPIAFYDEGSTAITSLSPNTGYFGTSVTITGRHFGSSQGTSTISFNGSAAPVTSWSDTSIVVTVPIGAVTGNVVVTVAGLASNGLNFTVFPTGWSDQDIGGVAMAGSASYGDDKFTVSGDGSQLGNTADAFNFAYQSLSGDGTIIARLVSLQGTSGLQGAGIMIRETLAAGSTYAALDYTNNGQGYWYPNLMYRTTTGGSTSLQHNAADLETLPLWMKLVRGGSTFTAYESTNGVNWTQVGTSITISMATNVYVGLFANSGDTLSLGTATFDNVVVLSSASSGGFGVLSGTITKLSDGTAISGAVIQVIQRGVAEDIANSDSNGKYVLYLRGGAYDIEASASGFGTALDDAVLVPANVTTTLNFSLSSPGSIAGTVTQADGVTAIQGATVQALVGYASAGSVTTGSNGTYTLSGLSAGTYQVQASASGYVPTTQSESVTANGTTTANFSLQTLSAGALSYIYDAAGRLVGVINPNGNTATYTYDAVGNLLSITRQSSSQLAVISFTPGSGPVGGAVTIYGTGFSSTPSQNTVKFNGVVAIISSASSTQLSVTVPFGATSGSISVTTSAGTATSTRSFTVTNP